MGWVSRPVMLLVLAGVTSGASAQWVQFVDETVTRIDADPWVAVDDTDEKEYAWGDVDRDGDTDLVIVRKEPFTSPGKRVSYLLINRNGVLTDRTDQYATASSVPGDLGFKTPTNTRDAVLVDLDLDGWLDLVTAVTISDGDPKFIGHPRIYMNLGCTGACDGTVDWLGFRYDEPRIPTMLALSGNPGFNPRFCSVDAGDLTGDGYPELWFGDYDSSGAGGSGEPSGADFDDRLLINAGASNPGYFSDQTSSRFAGVINIPGSGTAPFPRSAFGAAANIRDLNGDGLKDIIKQTSLNDPLYVGAAYNTIASQGNFHATDYEVIIQNSPYFVQTGDLNNDGKLDLAITDDGADRYMLNQGNDGDGHASLTSFTFSFLHNGTVGPPFSPQDDGFGSDSVIADLNKDGWNDVLITDVDVDIGGCDRRMHIYRNLGGTPGGFVQLQEQTSGPQFNTCSNSSGNPSSCIVASIPANKLEGVHDVAVFDINGDTWLDLVVGRCSSTEVYMNVPQGVPGAGGVGDAGGSSPLLVAKTVGSEIELSWGASCAGTDTDYAIYEGKLGSWHSHERLECSTAGATTRTLAMPGDSRYYLVVPHNGVFEGSYGLTGSGAERGQGAEWCRPIQVDTCD